MKLYSYFRSSAAYRLRIALNLKAIEHQIQPVNLLKGEHKSDEYLALNPQGLVPALELDDGRVINQSTAMLEFLESQYSQHPLLPADSFEAAQVRAWVNIIACDIHPIDNLRVLKYLTGTLGASEDQKTAWYQHWITEGFKALEPQLQGPFCFGDAPTLADVYLVPQVYNALRFETDMSQFPKIMAIYQHCNQQAAFSDAKPESQADAPGR
ncbi:MAG: maleylacetoacetate isomerase [Cellvibrionaceae bacterium]|nr:maleylacetoacetate isomerase [Cellvibrionaceae bacterium]